jgi:cyclic beta-1,2-glucan synthetase
MAFAALGEGTKAAELFALLNPVNRTRTRADVQRYRVEPYVVAADVYSVAPHVGRGGWTWYTGSAGWMYRSALESMLGFRLRGSVLCLTPCFPPHWPRAQIVYHHRSARYEILIENPEGVSCGIIEASLDGAALPCDPLSLDLLDDASAHHVRLVLGNPRGGDRGIAIPAIPLALAPGMR